MTRIKIEIDWYVLLIKSLVVWGVTTFVSYVIFTMIEKIIGKDLPKVVKSIFPVALATAIAGVFFTGPLPLRLIVGFAVGAATTTFYDWGVQHLFTLMETIFGVFLGAVKSWVEKIKPPDVPPPPAPKP